MHTPYPHCAELPDDLTHASVPEGYILGGSPAPPMGAFQGGPSQPLPGILPPPVPDLHHEYPSQPVIDSSLDSAHLHVTTEPPLDGDEPPLSDGGTASPVAQEPDEEMQGWLDDAEQESTCSNFNMLD